MNNDTKQTQTLELIIRAQAGDTQAFDELYRLKLRTIFFHVSRMIRNPSDVEDVAQEVGLKMYKGIATLKVPEAFNGWLQRVITNECYRFTHKNRHKLGHANIDDYANIIEEEDKEFLPKEYLETTDTRRTILEAIDSLPPKRKRAIIMYFYDDMSQKEIAYALGISTQTVSTNIMRAKDMIKKKLEKTLELGERPTSESTSNARYEVDSTIDETANHTVVGSVLASSAQAMYPDGKLDILSQMFSTAIKNSSTANGMHVAVGAKVGAAIGVKMIALMISGIVTMGGAGYGAYHCWKISPNKAGSDIVYVQEVDAPSAGAVNYNVAAAKITFVGGECDCNHLNPKSADLVDAPPPTGVVIWQIRDAADGRIVREGTGLDVSAQLMELYDTKQDGVYKLTFYYTGDNNHAYTFDRDFSIDTGVIASGTYE
ncbi:MAG: RNA polymerase sigma factor [Clostridiales Family XIII bacterium]|jgi:RNA polymerase sigma-70 factor (ECF subfamily)|nr:RNA polymerase sigma factor [Clostridiales Family XIII bacterium]